MSKLNFAKRACAVLIACAATAIALQAQTFGVLHNFDGTEGGWATAGLVQATDGNLYATTHGGAYYEGTVLRITPSGTLTTLYSFCAQSGCPDGASSNAALVQATDGNFYGTTTWGGAYDEGTIFKITPGGTLTTLHSFCSQAGYGDCPDGRLPSGLIQASDGDFYGTTAFDGAYGEGTVFRVTPRGTLTTLYSFCSQGGFCADGAEPAAGVIQATDGDFYGTTSYAGAYCSVGYVCGGTVFKITPDGALTTLYSFCSQSGCVDGDVPSGGLIQAADGNFYGTTLMGGSGSNPRRGSTGTVFRITPDGTFTTLYSFCSQELCADGEWPSGLIQGSDGNLFGTTAMGGANAHNVTCLFGGAEDFGCGTIFRLSTTGQFTTLYNFCPRSSCTDGNWPMAPLLQDTNGKFYGTAQEGGVYGDGTAFVFSTGLAPFVETEPNHGKVGRVIQILGTNLGGASSVTFNGTPAVFKAISNSLIGAVVPAGATTGTVQVTTPGGVLSSNVPFRVVQ